MTFIYHGTELPLFAHKHNDTLTNERAVEIPAVQHWLGRQHGEGLEIGNVLGHYGVTGHRVIDRYEEADGVEPLDVFDVDGQYDWVVSISTLEHVRWDEEPRNAYGGTAAVFYAMGLVRPGGGLIVTLPLGQNNPTLDDLLERGRTFSWDLGWRSTVLFAEGKHAKPVWIGEWAT